MCKERRGKNKAPEMLIQTIFQESASGYPARDTILNPKQLIPTNL